MLAAKYQKSSQNNSLDRALPWKVGCDGANWGSCIPLHSSPNGRLANTHLALF